LSPRILKTGFVKISLGNPLDYNALSGDALSEGQAVNLTSELEERYWETIERTQEAKSSFHVEVIEFSMNKEIYAVDIKTSRGITRYPRMVQIPGSPSSILGAMTFRGRVIPVADFRQMMGLPPMSKGDDARIVVVADEEEVFGLAVDEILGITEIDLLDIQPPPTSFVGPQKEVIRGQVKTEDQLVILVDIGAVISLLGCGSEEVSVEA